MSTININELTEEELELILDRAQYIEEVVAFGQDFKLRPVDGVEPSEDPGTWWVVHIVTVLVPSTGRAVKLPILYPADVAVELGLVDDDNLQEGILIALDQLNTDNTQEGTDQ